MLPGMTGKVEILDPTVCEAIDEGRARGNASLANPNALGERYIGKVLQEARDAFIKKGTNSTPPANMSLKALLNHFKKENNVNNLTIYDATIDAEHGVCKSLARTAHDWLKTEIFKKLNREGKECVLQPWGKVPSDLLAPCCLELEALANQHGLPLYKCNDSSVARLLLALAHKHWFDLLKKKNKEVSATADINTDGAVFEEIREELASQEYINLDNGDNDAGSSLSLASSLASSCSLSVGGASVGVSVGARAARAARGAVKSSSSRGGSSSSGTVPAKKRRVIRQESED